jgi:HAD superfamily phosphoserine phosphatase-like hydrolase
MRYLALFDFDNVIYKGHSVFDVIKTQEKDKIIESRVWEVVSSLLLKYKKGEISYKKAASEMLEAWTKGLMGKKYKNVLDYTVKFFRNNSDNFYKYFENILPKLKLNHDVYLVTANFQFISESVKNKYDLSGYLSSEAEVENGMFTGRVKSSLVGNKGAVVDFFKKYPEKKSIAVGDSENDVDMLKQAEAPICFQPNEKLRDVAKENGWLIIDEKSAEREFAQLLKQY